MEYMLDLLVPVCLWMIQRNCAAAQAAECRGFKAKEIDHRRIDRKICVGGLALDQLCNSEQSEKPKNCAPPEISFQRGCVWLLAGANPADSTRKVGACHDELKSQRAYCGVKSLSSV